MESLSGRLLVATPAIAAGVFERSVVYVLDHDEDGALGVIVNRPLGASVAEFLPGWGELVNDPTCLFEGGPVATDSALAIGVVPRGSAPLVGWRPMNGRVGLLDLEVPPPEGAELTGMRVFAGYAGWTSGQLEAEVEEGSWLVVEALDSDLFGPRPDRLWRDVLRRQRDDRQLWATFPQDPAMN
jgi:putative transcriptional regulator